MRNRLYIDTDLLLLLLLSREFVSFSKHFRSNTQEIAALLNLSGKFNRCVHWNVFYLFPTTLIIKRRSKLLNLIATALICNYLHFFFILKLLQLIWWNDRCRLLRMDNMDIAWLLLPFIGEAGNSTEATEWVQKKISSENRPRAMEDVHRPQINY